MPDLAPGLDFVWNVAALNARRGKHEFIAPAHLFMGLCLLDARPVEMRIPEELAIAIRPEGDALREIFSQFKIDAEFRRRLQEQVGEGHVAETNRGPISRSPASKAAFVRAVELSAGAAQVTALHLMAALIDETDSQIVALLKQQGVDPALLKAAALAGSAGIKQVKLVESALAKFGKDLTALARDGKLHECIGRRDELLRIIQTLQRDTKNNPLLLGDAGVGKTAIVEGLAWRIVQGKSLPGKRIIQVNVADLVAGTKYRGEFEERLQSLLAEAGQSADTILFIDEIHTLVGAGDRSGGSDAANIMKPALARGELHLIGATTREEFRQSIEKDPALERRFQPIVVGEPTEPESREILDQGYRQRFEKQHQVTIEDAAIDAAVGLSARYLPDRRLPDKAIDLLDEACARVAVPVLSVAPGGAPRQGGLVTAEVVARVLAQLTGIRVGQLSDREGDRLIGMAAELKRRVIGQDDACEAIAQAVQRSRAGLRPAGRPVGVFLFVGPTGVGKTELAKATTEFLFGSEKPLVRLDMSEYMERHTTSRLVGAPPGYVGHEEDGQLTGALRRTPYCVVLLDEVEKAHPDVLNLFLQLFDDGRLTDSHGRTADGSNALFIMTSNIGHEAHLGFAADDTDQHIESLMAAIRQAFRPEFLNRLGEIVVFKPLLRSDTARIVRLQLDGMARLLAAQGLHSLEVRDAAVERLAEEGYHDVFGARELQRVIKKRLQDPLAGMLLRGDLKPGHMIVVDVKGGQLTIDIVGGATV